MNLVFKYTTDKLKIVVRFQKEKELRNKLYS